LPIGVLFLLEDCDMAKAISTHADFALGNLIEAAVKKAIEKHLTPHNDDRLLVPMNEAARMLGIGISTA
jgi:hypothetical protein